MTQGCDVCVCSDALCLLVSEEIVRRGRACTGEEAGSDGSDLPELGGISHGGLRQAGGISHVDQAPGKAKGAIDRWGEH